MTATREPDRLPHQTERAIMPTRPRLPAALMSRMERRNGTPERARR